MLTNKKKLVLIILLFFITSCWVSKNEVINQQNIIKKVEHIKWGKDKSIGWEAVKKNSKTVSESKSGLNFNN